MSVGTLENCFHENKVRELMMDLCGRYFSVSCVEGSERGMSKPVLGLVGGQRSKPPPAWVHLYFCHEVLPSSVCVSMYTYV